MGQQQLLLIALSVIIVGAAVAVGVNMMTEGQEEVKQDMIYQRAQHIAQKYGEIFNKPGSMGGFGGVGADANTAIGSDVDEFCDIISIEAVSGRTQVTEAVSDADGNVQVTIQAGDINSDGSIDETHQGTFIATTTGEADWNDSDATRATAISQP